MTFDFFKKKVSTSCSICHTECYTVDKLEKHKQIAHQDHDTTRESRRALAKGKGNFG